AVYLANEGESLREIRKVIETEYYSLDFTLDSIRKKYRFDVSCQGSVLQALEAFFESVDFEDAIRNAISIGGDSDTIAAICGSIAGAYYGIPQELEEQTLTYQI
ncbi:MAG: ADP-ribosylglycohydrolase family protein, partial [Blautia hydrogenotrophica]